MHGTFSVRWHELNERVWFLPGLITVLGPILAFIMLAIDRTPLHSALILSYGGGPSSAISILSTIASSLATVVGLIFSIAIITLQLVSSQYTPRAMHGFMQDRITQVIAGAFVGIFAYCIVVLTAVRESAGPRQPQTVFVPAVGVAFAIALAFLALALLLVFIYHIGQSIQVSTMAHSIAGKTLRAVDHLYPTPVGRLVEEDGVDLVRAWHAAARPALIYIPHPGYVRTIALVSLTRELQRSGIRLHLTVCPGDFVTPKTVVAEVWPAVAADDICAAAIRRYVSVVSERTIEQDAAFGVRQLADIALRAISPAVNDPTTAVTCIGYLQSVIERLAERAIPDAVRGFTDERVTVVMRYHTFKEYVELLVEIGRYATGDVRVSDAVLKALDGIAQCARAAGAHWRLSLLEEAVSAVAQPAREDARTDHDRALLRVRRARVERTLHAGQDQ